MLTASVSSASTFIGTGSLTASPPAAIRIEVFPANRRARTLPGTTAPAPAEIAIVAEPTLRGSLPPALEIRARTQFPPALMKTMLRMVCPDRPTSDGHPGEKKVPPGVGLP